MTKNENTTANSSTLRAAMSMMGWRVVDGMNGEWCPNEEAESEIDASANPAELALAICIATPDRGFWMEE